MSIIIFYNYDANFNLKTTKLKICNVNPLLLKVVLKPSTPISVLVRSVLTYVPLLPNREVSFEIIVQHKSIDPTR